MQNNVMGPQGSIVATEGWSLFKKISLPHIYHELSIISDLMFQALQVGLSSNRDAVPRSKPLNPSSILTLCAGIRDAFICSACKMPLTLWKTWRQPAASLNTRWGNNNETSGEETWPGLKAGGLGFSSAVLWSHWEQLDRNVAGTAHRLWWQHAESE